MADYKQSETTGTIKNWTRCKQITIQNPYGAPPVVAMIEEVATQYPDNSVKSVEIPGSLDVVVQDINQEITLINPMTGESLGKTITFGEVYAILFSLYIDTATKRDAQV